MKNKGRPVENDVTKPSKPGELQDGFQQNVGADAYDLSNLLLLEDVEVIMTITKMFETTMSESLANLKFSVEKMEWDDVVFISHKLKSSLGVIQIHSIFENMYVVEMSAKKRQNLEAILPLVNASIADYCISLPIIKSAIQREASHMGK